MSHNVEKCMFTGKKPWWFGNQHQQDAIGVDLGEGPVTSKEAIMAAGLDWNVAKVRLGYQVAGDGPDEVLFQPAANHCALLRDSDMSLLGVATDDYQPLQNREAFEFLDRLVEEGDLLYHTAGSLEGGQRVWILAQTPMGWTIRRRSGALNHHHAFLNCMLGHNGKASLMLMPTDIRVECANTAGFAQNQAEKESLIFRIPHRGDVEAKLGLAIKALEVMVGESEERRRVLQELAQHAMTTDEFVDFATSIFLGLDGEQSEIEEAVAKFYEKATDRSKTMMENKVADVARLFVRGIGAEGDSGYDALNAWTEYFDHFDIDGIKSKVDRGLKAAKAVASSWVGAGAERKALVYKRLAMRVRR
jgi:phage/plasmid-like protein (TIGR03299 family)